MKSLFSITKYCENDTSSLKYYLFFYTSPFFKTYKLFTLNQKENTDPKSITALF